MKLAPVASAILLAIASTAAIAYAKPTTTEHAKVLSAADADIAVMAASHNVAHVSSTFAGPDGLTGAVIAAANNPPMIGWLSTTGKAVLVGGTLYGADGQDLTHAALVSQGIIFSPEKALETATSKASMPIMLGKSGPIITALFDPNCIFCHLLYKQLKPKVDAGQIRVRYVVVGTLKESSIPRAAAILAAKDPAAALEQDEAGFNEKTEEGGFAPDKVINAKTEAVVKANNELFRKSGAQGTPAILYRSKATGKIEMTQGMPRDVDAFLANLGQE